MNEIGLAALLDQIRVAATDACAFVEGMSKDDFLADKRTQNAVIMSLMVIGEAAKKINDRFPEFVADRGEIPWLNIRGMRNRIAHGYFDINLETVWVTVQRSLPDLLANLPSQSRGEDPG